ncbi:MAG: hypothetical protein ACRDT6_24960 [Micromonosporaceae bacterium]
MTDSVDAYQTAGRWHRPLLYFVAAMAVTTVISVIGLFADDRMLVGAPIWAKPLKFSISFVVYGVTWSWLYSLQTRYRRGGWWLGTVAVVASVIEMVIIIGQTVRGHRSHFNTANDFDQVLWIVMGASIVVLFFANLVWALALWRQGLGDRSLNTAIRVGVVLSLVCMGLAFLMTSPTAQQLAEMRAGADTFTGAHSVGAADGGPGLPLLNWSTTGGDLRIPHFIGMHALEAIPLVAALLLWLAPRVQMLRPEVRRDGLIKVAGAGYAGLVALVTWQALRGQSIVAPDALTLTAAAVLLGAVVIGTAVALTRGATGPESVPTQEPSPDEETPVLASDGETAR